MNQLRIRSLSRDNAVLKSIEEWGCMSLQQIKLLHFSDISAANNCDYRKAHERCYKLFKRGKLKRWREEEGHIYSLDSRKGRTEHKLMVNWVRLWFHLNFPNEVIKWKYEDDYKMLRADGFSAVENKQWKSFRFYFIELDRGFNAFDKVDKYNELFDSGLWSERWWAKYLTKDQVTNLEYFGDAFKKLSPEQFPLIFVVTTTETRKKEIDELIAANNKNGLRFIVKLFDEIKHNTLNNTNVCVLK